MRKDMFKVIVERPRTGGHGGSEPRRRERSDTEAAHESIRARHRDRKWLNENLRPLERWLAAQVGRPWNRVYAELCANIDRRSTVQQHIHQHVEDFVAVTVVRIDGNLHAVRHGRKPRPLGDKWGSTKYFVDPDSGLLRYNRQREQTRRKQRDATAQQRARASAERRELSPFLQLHQVDGMWYVVDLALIPASCRAGYAPYDVMRRRFLRMQDEDPTAVAPGAGSFHLYGRDDVFAWRKRQLGGHELHRYGLHNNIGTED